MAGEIAGFSAAHHLIISGKRSRHSLRTKTHNRLSTSPRPLLNIRHSFMSEPAPTELERLATDGSGLSRKVQILRLNDAVLKSGLGQSGAVVAYISDVRPAYFSQKNENFAPLITALRYSREPRPACRGIAELEARERLEAVMDLEAGVIHPRLHEHLPQALSV